MNRGLFRFTLQIVVMMSFAIISGPLGFSEESVYIEKKKQSFEFLYSGMFAGPALESPSLKTPVGRGPINLTGFLRAGYRLSDDWSTGIVGTFGFSSSDVKLYEIGIAGTKFGLIRTSDFNLDADFRLMYSTVLKQLYALQSFQSTTYTPAWTKLMLLHLSLVHVDFVTPLQMYRTFPVLAYRLSRAIQPAIYMRATFTNVAGNWVNETIGGPGVMIFPWKRIMIAPGLAVDLTAPSMNTTAVITYLQAQVL